MAYDTRLDPLGRRYIDDPTDAKLTLIAGTAVRAARSAAGIIISSGGVPHFAVQRVREALHEAGADSATEALVVGALVYAAHRAEGIVP